MQTKFIYFTSVSPWTCGHGNWSTDRRKFWLSFNVCLATVCVQCKFGKEQELFHIRWDNVKTGGNGTNFRLACQPPPKKRQKDTKLIVKKINKQLHEFLRKQESNEFLIWNFIY